MFGDVVSDRRVPLAQYRYEEGRLAVLEHGMSAKGWGHPDFPPAVIHEYIDHRVARREVTQWTRPHLCPRSRAAGRAAHAERLEWHNAPAENLEHIDVEQLATARQTIDIAAYVLTDWAVMDALRTAARRGVGVRIILDGSQFGLDRGSDRLDALLAEPNVLTRIKPSKPDIMHLKAYAIDGRLLRTGSAFLGLGPQTPEPTAF